MEIKDILIESCPSARFIGKCYGTEKADWAEFWANGWFDTLENHHNLLSINANGYSELIRSVNSQPEHWLGMFFAKNTTVPDGFECVDIPLMEYAVCYLYGDPNKWGAV